MTQTLCQVVSKIFALTRCFMGGGFWAAVKPLAVLILVFAAFGCILPPSIDKAQILPENELEIISLMQRGKNYSQAGRFDLAEYQYRQILRRGVSSSAVYNDLGYVLQAMLRVDEAEAMFRTALEKEPRNLVARHNLARLLVLREKVADARRMYLSLLDYLYRLTKREALEILGSEGVSDTNLATIYRDLSMLEYRDGRFDESLCYSRRAFEMLPDFVQTAQHARLLLSLGQLPQAQAVLNQQALTWDTGTPPKVQLDLVISHYALDQFGQSERLLDSLLSRTDLDAGDRQTARLLRIMILSRRYAASVASGKTKENPQNDEKNAGGIGGSLEEKEALEALAEEFPNFCKTYAIDQDGYWPDTFRDEMSNQKSMLCRDDQLILPD